MRESYVEVHFYSDSTENCVLCRRDSYVKTERESVRQVSCVDGVDGVTVIAFYGRNHI